MVLLRLLLFLDDCKAACIQPRIYHSPVCIQHVCKAWSIGPGEGLAVWGVCGPVKGVNITLPEDLPRGQSRPKEGPEQFERFEGSDPHLRGYPLEELIGSLATDRQNAIIIIRYHHSVHPKWMAQNPNTVGSYYVTRGGLEPRNGLHANQRGTHYLSNVHHPTSCHKGHCQVPVSQ